MAKTVHTTSTPNASRRRFGAGLLAVMGGSVITSGVAAGTAASVGDLIPSESDAGLIAACAQFNAIERKCRDRLDAAHTADEESRAERFRTQLCGGDDHRDWPVLNQICTTPGSSYAAAVALASSIAIFDTGTTVAPEDDPDGYVSERLLGALMRCLLGSASV